MNAPVSKPVVRTGGVVAPLVPTTIDESYRLAQAFAHSGVVPDSYKTHKVDRQYVNKSPEEVAATVFSAMQVGAAVGLGPVQSLQAIYVVNNKFTLWGEAPLGVCMTHPEWAGITETFEGEEPEDGSRNYPDTFAAVCRVWRKYAGTKEPVEVVQTFSVGDAKRGGLWTKTGPWQVNPKRMMKLRARAFALRDLFADALMGLGQTYEELRDVVELEQQPDGSHGLYDQNAEEAPPERPKPEAIEDRSAVKDVNGSGEPNTSLEDPDPDMDEATPESVRAETETQREPEDGPPPAEPDPSAVSDEEIEKYRKWGVEKLIPALRQCENQRQSAAVMGKFPDRVEFLQKHVSDVYDDAMAIVDEILDAAMRADPDDDSLLPPDPQ